MDDIVATLGVTLQAFANAREALRSNGTWAPAPPPAESPSHD